MGRSIDPIWRAAGLSVLTLAVVSVAFLAQRRVPVLAWFDLGMHELGHLLALPLGSTAHFLAGSVFQVAVPAGVAIWLLHRGDTSGSGFAIGWTGTALRDVAVYVADAPFQRLELIGGEHDWNVLLSSWQLLDRADMIATGLTVVAGSLAVAGLVVASHPIWSTAFGPVTTGASCPRGSRGAGGPAQSRDDAAAR